MLSSNEINKWADFWHYQIGVNVIPANTESKETYENWSQWQDKTIPDELHEQRKKNGEYNKGIAIITGKIWRGKNKGKYLNGIDCDNKKAIEEICTKDGKTISLEELAKWTIVEQHKDNPNKAHIYVISTKPFKNKSSTAINLKLATNLDINDIPSIEVKCEKHIMFCTPSIHQDGYPYEILDCKEPALCDEFEYHLNNIFKKYGIEYSPSTLIPIDELFKSETTILQGQNRHEAVLRVSESLIQRNKKILPLAKIKKLAYEWNQQHCNSPLNDKEFETQWNDALKFVYRSKSKSSNNYSGNNEEINLVEVARQNCLDLFVDQYNIPNVRIKINGHIEILGVDSQRFKNWLFRFFYEKTGKLSSEQVENIIKILKSEAEFAEIRKRLELRVAKSATDDFTFYYDLTNSNWSAVKITSQGWTIENSPPILFRRYANQLPQVNPILPASPSFWTIDDIDDTILDKFIGILNVKDNDNKLLLKCYIISLFIPEITKPILMLHGEQGSAKSTLEELIKMLVDPSIVRTLTFPRDINELIQQLSHNYIAYYDNVSTIKEWISDVFCRASTGSGHTKRQLYSDDDDIIYNFKRCIGINGINLGATKADLLDRGIIIQLERILKEKRRKLDDIWKECEILRPQLLGYIFDILVKVLHIKQKGGIKIPNGLNRMADFEEYAEIISRCMGYPEGEFLRVYQDNIGVQIDEAIQANPLSMAVIQLMDDIATELDKTPTELHIELNGVAETKLKINIQKIKAWPKYPNQLSRRLTEAQTILREKGIVIEKYKDEKGHRKIKIRKVSSISPYRQESENQEQNPNKSLDDTLDDTKETSSNNKDRNQEQNNGFGRFDGVDDTLHIKVREHLEKGKTLKCHHKNCYDKAYLSLREYNNHCFSRHPKQPMYPDLSLIRLMKLEPKENPWET